MSLAFRPLAPALGIEVQGVDLRLPIDDAAFAKIEAEYNQNSLMLVRGQNLAEDQHVQFSQRFGELQIHIARAYLHPNYPEIFVLSNIIKDGKPVGIADAGQAWHADYCYVEIPCRGSLLYARKVPEREGERSYGDTIFASAGAAYEALSDDMKSRLEGLTVRQSYKYFYDGMLARGSSRLPLTKEQEAEVPPINHPVVLPHPITGRKAIYVNRCYSERINELDVEESDALLQELFAHVIKPEFCYRHRWEVGDLLMWDNYALQHLAVADYALPQERLMHRTTVMLGDDYARDFRITRTELMHAAAAS